MENSLKRDGTVLLRLAEQAADRGEYERVSELYASAARQGIGSDDTGDWHRLLIEAGDFATAKLLPGPTCGAAPEEHSAQASVEEAGDFLDFEPGSRREDETSALPRPILSTFLRWFGGRGDVYARQWHDARRDRGGYWPVREPLDEGVVEQHLLGRITIGQYVLHPDNTVGFAALDLDPTPEAMAQHLVAAPGESAIVPALLEYAGRIVRSAANLGLPALREDTGGVGLHVWLFFEPRITAERARALLRELLWRAGPQPPAAAVELFPKQSRLGGKGLGNLIKLPLGLHQATLRRSGFLDEDGRPVADAAALSAIRACPPESIDRALAHKVVPLQPGNEPRTEALPELHPPAASSPRALAEALANVPPGEPATKASDRILAGCTVLRELSRQAHEEQSLSTDAARALLYSVGLVGRENERIDAIFAQAGVSRKEIERARRGLQGPVGCKKLRAAFPGLCSDIGCPEPAPGGYATPALLAFRKAPPAERRRTPWAADAEIHFEAGEAAPDVDARLRRLESLLERLVEETRPRAKDDGPE